MTMSERYVATTSLGLEPLLETELRQLGAKKVRRIPGGVAFLGNRHLMMLACLELRTAHRVRWQLSRFRCRDADDLYRGVAALRWADLVPPHLTLAVDGFARNSHTLRDGRFVALRTKDAICDTVRAKHGERPSVDVRDPDVRIHMRVVGEDAVCSLDAGGGSLHARGYRTEQGSAPLRETLAAAIIHRTGWRGERPLIDPFCGSGTLLIEAALMAQRIAPGLVRDRRFGFERWPGHRKERWDSLLDKAEERILDPPRAGLWGSDLAPHAIAKARANAARAQQQDIITFAKHDARKLSNPATNAGPGILVANPPYGERMGDSRTLNELFRRFGAQLRGQFRGWDLWILLTEVSHRKALGLPLIRTWPFKNGALDVQLTACRVP